MRERAGCRIVLCMKLMLAVAMAVELAGCSVPEPVNEEVDAPPDAEDAAEIVTQEWAERMGAELGELPAIRWYVGECLDYGDGCETRAGEERWGGYAHGPFADPEIHVLVRGPIHESMLSHEVLHWALDERGDPDRYHEDMAWSQVIEVDDVLIRAGM